MILLWPFCCHAQTFKGFTVGEKVPNVVIPDILNNTVTSSSLAAFKGKLLILDFMATTCASCIKALPELESLQQKFKNKLQIMLVSSEKPQRIQLFLKRHPQLSLPFVARDSNLSRMFPHVYISHIVWINPERIVSAITDPEYVNQVNVETVLKGKITNWPIKREFPQYDFSQPILTLNARNIPAPALPEKYYYTAVINYMPGIQKEYKVVTDSVNHIVHTSLINYQILDLYRILFQKYRLPLTHIKTEMPNKERLFYNLKYGYYETWKTNNMYCLEASLPSWLSLEEQRQRLIEELNFYFGFQVVWKKQTVNCLILKQNKKSAKSITPLNKTGLSPSGIIGILNNQVEGMPAMDETNALPSTRIPVSEEQVSDSTFLYKILERYGYQLTIEPRQVEFMVISEAKKF